MVEELRNAVQVVGSLAAILVLVFGAARYFGRKDERETVTAQALGLKADRHEVHTLSERVRELERAVSERFDRLETAILARLDRLADDLRGESKHTGNTTGELSLKVGRLEERQESLASRVSAVEGSIERRGNERRRVE